MTTHSPIGVFDSGLGGLSVLKELRDALPGEDFVYLGDVARLPYGTKSEAVVTRYSRSCVGFLAARGVKLIVIACNTATAMGLPSLRDESPIPLCGVIESGVRAGRAATGNGNILVLGTEATVKSEAYPAEFYRQGHAAKVEQIACPLLVPLAEEGWFDHDVTAKVITHYLARAQAKFDTVVLGCTHYPLLAPSFRRVLGTETALVHAGSHLAEEVREKLAAANLLNPASGGGKLRFCATDHVPKSIPIVRALFGHAADFDLVDL